MITDFTTPDTIQQSSTQVAKLNQAIAMLPTLADDPTRLRLLTQVVNGLPDTSAAMGVSLLIGSLDRAELDCWNAVVDVDRLRAAGDAMLLLLGYVEAANRQTDPAEKQRMIEKLMTAIAPDRAHTNAVDNAVIAVETGPLAF